mmetsp:Transcript_12066/g.44775  ORF Transcript_12066/g.44775 Transcript_12066/m.44775 type:complete len:211 (+) Transcript_12066:726-1358(+)
MPNPEAVRQRCEDVQRLAADSLLLLRRHVLQGAHVVQPVCELHDDDAEILCHGDEHLPEVLRLLLLLLPPLQLRIRVWIGAADRKAGQLRHLRLPFDNARHHRSEARRDGRKGQVRVLHGVVQKPRANRFRIHVELRQEHGHGHRVDDVMLSALPLLSLVRPEGQLERPLQLVHVGVGQVLQLRPQGGPVSPDLLLGLFAERLGIPGRQV